MTRTALWRIAPAVALGAVLALGGCASNIDDPNNSSSILVIEAIAPSVVETDVVKVTALFTAKTVQVTVTSTPRGGSTGSDLSDLVLDNYSVVYNPPLSTGTASASFAITVPVPSGGSTTFAAVIVPLADLLVGITPGTSTTATIHVSGHDVLGNPASAEAVATVNFGNFVND